LASALKASIIFAAIEFASPAMLGWLAAAALPLLVNLWSRRRHIETPWAAVDLLMTAVQERSRRIRLRELLLLAMRTGILLLVAMAAAEPLWRQAGGPNATAARTYHIIVLDRSFSMACRGEDESRFEQAKRHARRIVEQAPTGDAFTIVAWADAAENVLGRATFDSKQAAGAIQALEPSDAVADLAAALKAVKSAMDGVRREFPSLTRVRVVFLSDLAGDTWLAVLEKPVEGSATPKDADETAGLWRDLRAVAEIVVQPVDDGVRNNVAVADVSVEPSEPTLDQPAIVQATLDAFGNPPPTPLPIEFWLDGARIGAQSVQVKTGEKATATFETRVGTAGPHVFEVRLRDDVDSLPVDNRRWLSTIATRGPNVICFADAAAEAEDIARALNPHYREGAEAGRIAVEVAATAVLAAANLSAFDAILLCNVAELSPREQRLLERYVADGGALVVVLGDRVNAASYNDFFAIGSSDAQPAARSLLAVNVAKEPVIGDWQLDALDYRHPILAPFSGRSQAGLLGARVAKYYRLTLQASEAAPALAFSSGDPAIIVGNHGLGRVAVLATNPALSSGGEPWSTLAVSPSFVPLMRELFAYLSFDGHVEQLNRLVGEPLMSSAPLTVEGAGTGQWTTPDGTVTTTIPETTRRGIYTYREDSSNDGPDSPPSSTTIAVNIDPHESDLTAVDSRDLLTEANGRGAPAAATLPTSDGGAWPLNQYLLAVAAILLMAELTTAWLLGRGWA
jgi:hypothetical protein